MIDDLNLNGRSITIETSLEMIVVNQSRYGAAIGGSGAGEEIGA